MLLAAGVVAIAVLAAVLVAVKDGQAAGNTSTVSVSAAQPAVLVVQDVPGQLTIVGARTGGVTMTGQLHWTGHHPAVVSTPSLTGHTLRLAYRCATGNPCTGDLRLVVPGHTTVVLRQPSGHVVVSGLAGSLRITAASVDISASGLRSPALTAVITSGHLSATFDAPPRQLALTLTSAQATVWLPGQASYRVSQQVTSGYLDVRIPQAATATRTVSARISSGELALLTR